MARIARGATPADVREFPSQARRKPPVSPAGLVGPKRSPLGTRTPKARIARGATP